VQHGVGERGPRSRVTGEPVAGPATLAPEELQRNRRDIIADALAHPFDDDYHKARTPELERITVPFLSAANWGGQGIHPRGNFEAFMRAPSAQKWLEAHGDTHWLEFYTNYGLSLQKRFFGHFLKGEDTSWSRQPRVQLLIRHPGEKFVERHENEWPLARTQWTKFYLDPQNLRLAKSPGQSETTASYAAMGDGITFSTGPLDEPMEITGPVAAKLFVSSSAQDADLFLILRVFAPDGSEVTFQGAQDPHTPIAQGWLRASHRKLDLTRSLPYRPFHAHDEAQPLTPGEPVELDIEIWPTCIVVPTGYSVALTIRGKDYEYGGAPVVAPHVPYPLRGVGPFIHAEMRDRPPKIYGGQNTLHFSPGRQPWVMLPIIPAD
jgi:predicted acyl esterase